VTEHRIQFMTPLVRAIMAGAKSVTRRPVRAEIPEGMCIDPGPCGWRVVSEHGAPSWGLSCPYGGPGDVLAVCEELRAVDAPAPDGIGTMRLVSYAADGVLCPYDGGAPVPTLWPWQRKTQPSMYCPDWAIRTRLPLVSVRPERLSSVTDAEAVREGIAAFGAPETAAGFLALWDRMYGRGEYASVRNPWVWRLEWAPLRREP
jgi:hypothetical protein